MKPKSLLCFATASFLLAVPAFAGGKREHPEKYYQDRWCAEKRGATEVVMPDGARADCVTEKNAVEFDFGSKWAEAVGQSLFYSLETGKRAGIVLILESEADRKFLIRLNSTIEHFALPIDVWSVGKGAY